MSVKVMGQVWDLDLPSNEQSVLLAMADHADHEGKNSFPSIALVAWKTGMSENSVRRLRKKLETRKILVETAAEAGHVKCFKVDISAGIAKQPFNGSARPGNHKPTPSQIGTPAKLNPLPKSTQPPPKSEPPQYREPFNHPSDAAAPASSLGEKEETEHQKFMRLWQAAYLKKFNAPYKFNGGRDGKAAKELLNEPNATAEDLMEVVTRAWKAGALDPRKNFQCARLVNIWQIAAHWNTLQTELNPRPSTGSYIAQPPLRSFKGGNL